jgi:hypothetical protein
MTKRETLYAKFEGFEEEIAHCYFLLHERFIANPPLAKFWAEAAIDELQHCSILRFSRERGLMADVNVGPEETYEKLTSGLAKEHPLLYEAVHASLRSHHGAFADAAEQFSGDTGFAEAFRNLRRSVS